MRPLESSRKRFRVDPREIHFVRFVLEAAPGLCTLTTLDAATGLMAVLIPPGRESEFDGVLAGIATEIFLDPVDD